MPLELILAWNWPVGGVMLAVLTESTPQHHSTTMTRRCGWQPRVLVNKAEFPLVPDFCGKKNAHESGFHARQQKSSQRRHFTEEKTSAVVFFSPPLHPLPLPLSSTTNNGPADDDR